MFIRVRVCAPGTAYVIPARAGVCRVWWASWGRLGESGLSAPREPGPGSPLVAVFVGVRLGERDIPGNVLLSKIYILACSEPFLQRVLTEKDAQLRYPDGISGTLRRVTRPPPHPA